MKLTIYFFIIVTAILFGKNGYAQVVSITTNTDCGDVHHSGSISIQSQNNDITVSGSYVYHEQLGDPRSISVTPTVSHGVTLSVGSCGSATTLRDCEEDPDNPKQNAPIPTKSLNVTDSNQRINRYEVYNMSGALVYKKDHLDILYNQLELNIPKRQLFIIKLYHPDGSVDTEKIIEY